LEVQNSPSETNLLLQGEKLYLVAKLRSAEALKRSIMNQIGVLNKVSVDDTDGSNDYNSSEEDVDLDDNSQEAERVLVVTALDFANANDVI